MNPQRMFDDAVSRLVSFGARAYALAHRERFERFAANMGGVRFPSATLAALIVGEFLSSEDSK